MKLLSRVWLFEIPWTAAHQAPPSMGFSRQEYWSGVPSPSPETWAITEKLRRNEYGVFTRDIIFVIIQYLLLNTYYVPGMMKTFLHALFNLIFKARYEIDSTIFCILLMK